MKCAGFALTAMLGYAYAAPIEQSWTEPGGDYYYKPLARRGPAPKFVLGKDEQGRRVIDPIHMTLFGTAVSFVTAPLATRFWNHMLGMQTADSTKKANGGKRSVDADAEDLDLTFEEARKLCISSLVDKLFKANPNGGETDAAVCTSTRYRISEPSKTLEDATFKFTAQGQDYKYDCFILAGPVTFEVQNATDTNFIWEAPAGATFSNGVLTIV